MPVNVAELLGAGGAAKPSGPEPDFWDKTGGAFLAGAYQDPIVHALIGSEEGDKQAAEIQYATRNSTVADIMGVVGKFAPALITGIGSYAAGRTAATVGAEAFSASAAAYGARKAGEEFIAKPMVLRAAEMAGGALGSGAEQYGRGILEGDTQTDALKRGALGAVLTGGTEAALTGASKVLTQTLTPLSKMLTREDPNLVARVTDLTAKIKLADDAIAAGGKTDELMAMRRSAARELRKIKTTNSMELAAATFGDAEAQFAKESAKLGERIQQVSTDKMMADMQNGMGIAFGMPDIAEEGAAASVKLSRRIARMQSKQAQLDTAAAANRGYKEFALSPEERGADLFYFGMPKGAAQTTSIGGVQFPANYKNLWSRIKMGMFEAPETTAKRNGVTATKAVRDLAVNMKQARNMTLGLTHKNTQLWQELADITGNKFSLTSGTSADDWGLKMLHEWERPGGGLAAIEQKYGTAAAQKWQEIIDLKEAPRNLARPYGIEPDMDAGQMAAMGVGQHYPQHALLSGEEINNVAIMRTQKYFASRGEQLTFEQARDKLIRLNRASHGGMRRVGALDFQRQVPGTTLEKAAAFKAGEFPYPVETDPWRSGNEYFNGVSHRLAFAPVFGPNMELKDSIIEAAIKEGANPVEVRTMFDQLMGVKHIDEAMYKVSRTLTNMQVLSKMGLGVLANSTQTVNNFLAVGLRNASKGIWEATKGSNKEDVAGALGMLHGMNDNIRDVLEAEMSHHGLGAVQDAVTGISRNNPMDAAVRFFLKYTGFGPTEGINRMVASNTGLVTIRDTVGKAVAGRLRGDTLARAERMLDNFGVNLPAIVKRAQAQGLYGTALGLEDIDNLIGKAALSNHMWRSAQVLQFIPDQTRVPLWWSHPVGKVATQFKSFAFNQSKLIRDTVLREAGEGNLKPLAYMMTFYPAAGTAVNTAMAGFGREQKGSGLTRYLDAMMTVGGIGLAYNIGLGLHYKDPSTWLGPTAGDAMDFASSLFQQDTLGALSAKISRYPTYRLFRTLARGTEAGMELGGKGVMSLYDEASPSGSGEALKPADLSVLLRQGNPANK